jgi:ribosome-binding factor A
MSKHRPNRLAETLKEEISQLIRVELKDPRIGFVTLTSVDVAGDLAHAKVYVSVLGTEDEGKISLEVLNRAAGFVRCEIGKRIRLRHVPAIVFVYDPSIEHGAHIAKLLRDVGVTDDEGKGESHES